MTKLAHFLPVKITNSTEDYASLYIQEMLRLHGVSVSIISYRIAEFTAHSRNSRKPSIQHFSKSFNPQKNGKSERTIKK